MFDVLVYLYEQYWRPEACPESAVLARKLTALGFEPDEISDALRWLEGLLAWAHGGSVEANVLSTRVYCDVERDRLGSEAAGFLCFLESAGVLTPCLREVVLDRVSAVPKGPLGLDDFKVLLLMVFWRLGEEPDALILDELFVDEGERVVH